jgi:hypothetical protein
LNSKKEVEAMRKKMWMLLLGSALLVLRSQKGSVDFKLPNPGIGLTWIIELVLKVLGTILPVVTPSIREMLEKFLNDFYAKAKETPNPWDDFLAKFLMRMLGMVVPE